MEVLQVAEELEQAVALYRARAPKRVLEIGVWQGGTLREWLVNAARGAEIVAVDLHHPNVEAYPSWHRPDSRLISLYGNSQDEKIIASLREAGWSFDWVFIDGDHSIEGVRADVENYLPMVAPGGVLLLHDIVPPSDWAVGRFYPPGIVFAELAGKYDTDMFCGREPGEVSHGIGVVYL